MSVFSRLNGWQRVWAVVMVLWTLVAGWLGYRQFPRSIDHPRPRADYLPADPRVAEVMALMTTKTWDGDTCRLPYTVTLKEGRSWTVTNTRVLEPHKQLEQFWPGDVALTSMLKSHESDEDIKAVLDHYAAYQIITRTIPRAGRIDALATQGTDTDPILCFSRELEESDMMRIAGDYQRAYAVVLKQKQMKHVTDWLFIWLVPGVALFVLAYSIEWTMPLR